MEWGSTAGALADDSRDDAAAAAAAGGEASSCLGQPFNSSAAVIRPARTGVVGNDTAEVDAVIPVEFLRVTEVSEADAVIPVEFVRVTEVSSFEAFTSCADGRLMYEPALEMHNFLAAIAGPAGKEFDGLLM